MAVSKPYKYSGEEKHNQFSLNTYATVLAASTEQTLTVPFLTSSSGVGMTINDPNSPGVVAVITVGSLNSVFVFNNATATYPSGSFSDPAGEMVNSQQKLIKQVKSGDVLHFITNANSVPVSVVFYLSN